MDNRYSVTKIGWIATVWGICVTAVLVWQSYSYTGVFAWLAEWQFRQFDRMFPVATIALIVLLLLLPFLLLIGWRLRRRRQVYGRATHSLLIVRSRLIGRGLTILAGLALLLSAVLAVAGVAVGSNSEKTIGDLSLINPDTANGSRVRARAWVRTDRIGYYRERFVFTGRDLFVAPLTTGNGREELQVFLEVQPHRKATAARHAIVNGIVREAAVPGGLEQLYRDAGYRIKRPTYVLFADKPSARWPFFSAAADLALIGLLLIIGALLARRHVKRLDTQPSAAVAPSDPLPAG